MSVDPASQLKARPSDHAIVWAAITQWAFDQLDSDDPLRREVFQFVTNRSMQIADTVTLALRNTRQLSRSGVPITRSRL